MTENSDQLTAQPEVQLARPQTPLKYLKVLPLLISTSLLVLVCLISPLALLTGMFNDTGDRTVTTVVTAILIVGILIVLSHAIVSFLSLRPYRFTNKMANGAFWVNIALLASLGLLVVWLLVMFALTSVTGDVSQSLTYRLFLLLSMLVINLVPALVVTSVVMSIIVMVKRKSITR